MKSGPTLTEIVQRHFDELAGEKWGTVRRVFVSFDDGSSVDIETNSLEDAGTSLVTRHVLYCRCGHQQQAHDADSDCTAMVGDRVCPCGLFTPAMRGLL